MNSGDMYYADNIYNLKVNKDSPIKYEGEYDKQNNKIINIKKFKYQMTKEEVKKILKEMDKGFPDIF